MFRHRDGIFHFSLNRPTPQLLLAVHAPFNDKAGLAKLAGNPVAKHGSCKPSADDQKIKFLHEAYRRLAVK